MSISSALRAALRTAAALLTAAAATQSAPAQTRPALQAQPPAQQSSQPTASEQAVSQPTASQRLVSRQAAGQPAAATAAIRLAPNVTSAQLAAMPAAQLVEFPNGLRMSVGDVRSLSPLAERLRKSSNASPGVLRQPLTGPVVAVKPGAATYDVLNASDNAVLQLPDGRKLSVAQFRAVQGQIRSTARARPQRATGPAIRVERGTPLAELLKRPDTDVLESPGGKRATVGELRRFASARGSRQ